MVKAKLDVYYTFKVMSEEGIQPGQMGFLVHCLKWEEFSDAPVATYKIMPYNESAVGGCSCPAWTSNCKHRKCVLEAVRDGKVNEFYKWRWTEKDGWIPTDDIHDITEFEIPPDIG